MHRAYCQLLRFPQEPSDATGLCELLRTLLFGMRDLLEQDFGMHPETAAQLVVPECAQQLRHLNGLETDNDRIVAWISDNRMQPTWTPAEARRMVNMVRWALWEIERCLRIARDRVFYDVPPLPALMRPRYPWIEIPVD
jgi:hypothetical protein